MAMSKGQCRGYGCGGEEGNEHADPFGLVMGKENSALDRMDRRALVGGGKWIVLAARMR